MNAIAQLKQRRAQLIKQQRDLHGATKTKTKDDKGVERDTFRSMTDEENTQYQAGQRDLDMLTVELAAEEREHDLKMSELRSRLGKDAVISEGRFASLGEQLVAVRNAAAGREDPRLAEVRKEERAALGANEAVDSEGGYLLEKQFAPGLLARTYSLGQILPRVRTVPIGPNSNSLVMNAFADHNLTQGVMGGIIGYWDAEAAAATASAPKFRQVELKLMKVRALVYATEEMLQDSVALEGVINEGAPKALQLKVEQAIVSGTGAGQPLGWMNSGALISVAKEVGQSAATILYENVLNMYARMHVDSLMDAVWFINQAALPTLAKMHLVVGTGGVPVWMPASGATGNPWSTLFGRPVIPIPYASAVGTVGDINFVDLGQYLAISKGGIQGVSSIHVQFLTGQTAFRFTYRINGQPLWDQPFTPLSNDQTYSPFVALSSRA